MNRQRTHTDYEGITYYKEDGIYRCIKAYLNEMNELNKNGHEVSVERLYTSTHMVSYLNSGEKERLVMQDVCLMLRNISHCFFKSFNPEEDKYHIFGLGEMNELTCGSKLTNVDKYKNILDRRQYLLIPLRHIDHVQLIVATDKMTRIWIYDKRYADKHTSSLRKILKDMAENYYDSLGRTHDGIKISNMKVPGQKDNYECGHLTIINAIKTLNYIKRENRMPEAIEYNPRELPDMIRALGAINSIIYQDYVSARFLGFTKALQGMFSDKEIIAETTVDKYAFLKYKNATSVKKDIKKQYKLICDN